MKDAATIQQMFARVRRDAPTMDGVRAAIFAAEVLGIDPLEVWLAVDMRFILAEPASKWGAVDGAD